VELPTRTVVPVPTKMPMLLWFNSLPETVAELAALVSRLSPAPPLKARFEWRTVAKALLSRKMPSEVLFWMSQLLTLMVTNPTVVVAEMPTRFLKMLVLVTFRLAPVAVKETRMPAPFVAADVLPEILQFSMFTVLPAVKLIPLVPFAAAVIERLRKLTTAVLGVAVALSLMMMPLVTLFVMPENWPAPSMVRFFVMVTAP